MARLLSALSLLLIYGSAFAEIAPEPPPQANTLGFILFGVLFVVMCVGFVWLVIWNDKKQKAKEGKE
jgi:hypothetical protein